MLAKSIASLPVIPATVPAKLAGSSSLSVPVSAANVTAPEYGELISTVCPAAMVTGPFAAAPCTSSVAAVTVKWIVVALLASLLSATSLLPPLAMPVASFQ
jgi:hypothetical protein